MLAKVAEDHAAQRNDSPDTLSDDVQPKRAPREVDLGPARDGRSIPWALILFVVLVAGATVWFMQNRHTLFQEATPVPSSATPSSATP